MSDFSGGRAAGLALAAGIALGSLVACSAGDATDPATVESAVVRATDCDVHPRFGRSLGSINAVLVMGPADIDAPHEALDGSFVCSVEPPQQGTASTLVIGAARFGDPAQAVEMVEWLRGGVICRPVAAVGPWMLFSGRPVPGPQDSPPAGSGRDGARRPDDGDLPVAVFGHHSDALTSDRPAQAR